MELDIKQDAVAIKSFDWDLLLQQTGRKEAIAKEILALFMQDLPNLQEQINSAFQNKQFKNLAEILHKLNGACSYCGMPKLKKLAQELELAIKENNSFSYEKYIHDIDQECNNLKIMIKKTSLI